MTFRAVLVDDEDLALRRLLRLLQDEPCVEVVGTASNGQQALDIVQKEAPDLLFLDIQMPGLSGFEVLKKLQVLPVVIFTTAYDNYALEAFETSAVDYLLKPIEKNRLHKALEKLKYLRSDDETKAIDQRRLETLLRTLERKQEQAFFTHIPARIGERILVIAVSDIAYFYAFDKYTFLVIGEKEHIIDKTLLELEARLDPSRFVRIHRSTIVNIDQVKEIVSLFGGRYLCRLRHPQKDLPVSRAMVRNLRRVFGF